jgi:sensor c-di-GMP phosphodiesterase-like protein
MNQKYMAVVPRMVFKVPLLDENGKPMMKRNPDNSIVYVNDAPVPMMKNYEFVRTGHQKVGEDTYHLSEFVVTDETPKQVQDALKKVWENEHSSVYTEDEFLEKFMPETKKVKDTEVKYKEAIKDRDAARAIADSFKSQLDRVEAELKKFKK